MLSEAIADPGPALVSHIDHLVLTVRSIDSTCAFYERALRLRRLDAPGWPTALHFGDCKLNLHEVGHTFEPKARTAVPGTADVCLITDQAIDEVASHLASAQVTIELGPIERIGARGVMTSLYFRDPDGNLVEVSRYP